MAYTPVEYPAEKGAFYALLKEQLEKYTENETDETAILANASAVLGIALKNINWVGFYMVKGEELVLGPFQGKPAVSRIGYGKGSAVQAGQKSAHRWWQMCIAFPDILPVTAIPMQK